MECASTPGHDEAGPSTGSRLHRGLETGARDGAGRAGDRRGSRRSGATARRPQRNSGWAQRPARVLGRSPRYRQSGFHRIDGHGTAHRADLRATCPSDNPGVGRKSAAIILDDAELETTIQGLRSVSFGNNGQLCYAGTRILAPHPVCGEFVDALAEMADGLVVGNPLDENVDIGPLVSSRQRNGY